MDTTLSVHNYGGNFLFQNFEFHGTFNNVTGTPAKNLTLALETKPLNGSSWTQHSTYVTDLNGDFNISIPLDTTYWDVRLAIKGDTMGVGNIISTTDAQLINQWVLGNGTMSGFDYYTADVNGSNNTTMSDVWGVFGRISGRFTSWPNNTKDIKFFTTTEFATINGSSTNYTSSIAGVTNFTFDILPGQPDSVVFYVVVPGDANGTGYNMARITPIEVVVGPAPGLENQIYNVIDTKVEYDFPTQSIEVNVPNISVQSGNLVELPVTLRTNGIELSSLQFGLRYDDTLLQFKGVIASSESMKWITYVNPNDNQIDWGGFDPTNNNTLKDGNQVVTLQFLALQPQNLWGASPLYTTNKFAGSVYSNDLTLTPTNGILQVLKMEGGNILNGNDMEVYPNPFLNEVTITFKVEETTNATLSVYDLVGRKMVTIIEGQIPNGQYSYNEVLGELEPGVYIVKLSVENGVPSFERIIKQ
jgi:5-hydroxyisourate hydrolase-like protein (transthyretin family)